MLFAAEQNADSSDIEKQTVRGRGKSKVQGPKSKVFLQLWTLDLRPWTFHRFPANDRAEPFAVLGQTSQRGQIGSPLVRPDETLALMLCQCRRFGQRHRCSRAALRG